jgi:hypothetical protein
MLQPWYSTSLSTKDDVANTNEAPDDDEARIEMIMWNVEEQSSNKYGQISIHNVIFTIII